MITLEYVAHELTVQFIGEKVQCSPDNHIKINGDYILFFCLECFMRVENFTEDVSKRDRKSVV